MNTRKRYIFFLIISTIAYCFFFMWNTTPNLSCELGYGTSLEDVRCVSETLESKKITNIQNRLFRYEGFILKKALQNISKKSINDIFIIRCMIIGATFFMLASHIVILMWLSDKSPIWMGIFPLFALGLIKTLPYIQSSGFDYLFICLLWGIIATIISLNQAQNKYKKIILIFLIAVLLTHFAFYGINSFIFAPLFLILLLYLHNSWHSMKWWCKISIWVATISIFFTTALNLLNTISSENKQTESSPHLLEIEEKANSEQSKNHPLYQLFSENTSVCFIGDSITAGSENGGYPWYVPLMNRFPNLRIHNISHGGATTKSIIASCYKELRPCDIYIIAIGTNDIRLRNPEKCAITTKAYIEKIKVLVELCRSKNPNSTLCFIAPWCSIPNDPIICMEPREKELLFEQYAYELEEYARQHTDCIYIDPNQALEVIVNHQQLRKSFLKDHIHPNYPQGCYLYSAAVWEACKSQDKQK